MNDIASDIKSASSSKQSPSSPRIRSKNIESEKSGPTVVLAKSKRIHP
jgi:hypothetical protein